jgi:hypothetical protein
MALPSQKNDVRRASGRKDLADLPEAVKVNLGVRPTIAPYPKASGSRFGTCAARGTSRGHAHMVDRITEHGRVRLCKASKDRAACTLEVSP